MKAKEIPEKVYLHDFTDTSESVFYVCADRTKETDIEYTRTDAFIDKACRWLSLNLQMLLNVFDVEYNTNDTKTEDFINDFRKAMEDKEL